MSAAPVPPFFSSCLWCLTESFSHLLLVPGPEWCSAPPPTRPTAIGDATAVVGASIHWLASISHAAFTRWHAVDASRPPLPLPPAPPLPGQPICPPSSSCRTTADVPVVLRHPSWHRQSQCFPVRAGGRRARRPAVQPRDAVWVCRTARAAAHRPAPADAVRRRMVHRTAATQKGSTSRRTHVAAAHKAPSTRRRRCSQINGACHAPRPRLIDRRSRV